jgi:hypothetical protein
LDWSFSISSSGVFAWNSRVFGIKAGFEEEEAITSTSFFWIDGPERANGIGVGAAGEGIDVEEGRKLDGRTGVGSGTATEKSKDGEMSIDLCVRVAKTASSGGRSRVTGITGVDRAGPVYVLPGQDAIYELQGSTVQPDRLLAVYELPGWSTRYHVCIVEPTLFYYVRK